MKQHALGENKQMAKLKRLAGALIAFGLAIGASSASAFPLYNFFGDGTSGALGGDNMYNPFDGRFFLQSGSMDFLPDTPLVPGTNATGTLEITMQLEGQVYNSAARGAQNVVPDGTVLGDFEFVMTYDNAELTVFTFGDPFVSLDVFEFNGGAGTGTLTYTNDTLDNLPEGDGSVDGEQEGDIIVFRTPDCSSLTGISCPSNFFEWSANANSSAFATTPVGTDGSVDPVTIFYDTVALGSTIPTGFLSLFHAGQPCTSGTPNDPQSTDFFCNPTPTNFATSGLPGTYSGYVSSRAAGIAVDAAIPEPAISALLGIGLAGIGFARRRATG
jgi:hypothetical protein